MLIYIVVSFGCIPVFSRFSACSGHFDKLQVIEIQLLAIFNFSPHQSGVNHPQKINLLELI